MQTTRAGSAKLITSAAYTVVLNGNNFVGGAQIAREIERARGGRDSKSHAFLVLAGLALTCTAQ